MSNAEIWIPDAKYWYVAPGNIVHYIRHHDYLPPKRFLNALENLDFNATVLPENFESYLIKRVYSRIDGVFDG